MPLPRRIRSAWFSTVAYRNMLQEADRWFPKETGGVLMGYWVVPSVELVVTQAIGPGPHAVHSNTAFVPDHEYQANQIALAYERSGRLHNYLGDWHTHPASAAQLSLLDRKTLKTIAAYSAARAPLPVMAILGDCSPWTFKLWIGLPIRIGSTNIAIRTSSLAVKMYDP
jgi:integrative and conjugative element protein (TIGR02256 family)